MFNCPHFGLAENARPQGKVSCGNHAPCRQWWLGKIYTMAKLSSQVPDKKRHFQFFVGTSVPKNVSHITTLLSFSRNLRIIAFNLNDL